jgi:hypothetical protein
LYSAAVKIKASNSPTFFCQRWATSRFGGYAAQWIEEIARRRTDFEVELIDLMDYPMPLFAEEASPLYAPSKNWVGCFRLRCQASVCS